MTWSRIGIREDGERGWKGAEGTGCAVISEVEVEIEVVASLGIEARACARLILSRLSRGQTPARSPILVQAKSATFQPFTSPPANAFIASQTVREASSGEIWDVSLRFHHSSSKPSQSILVHLSLLQASGPTASSFSSNADHLRRRVETNPSGTQTS
jgi:hypothetical protein